MTPQASRIRSIHPARLRSHPNQNQWGRGGCTGLEAPACGATATHSAQKNAQHCDCEGGGFCWGVACEECSVSNSNAKVASMRSRFPTLGGTCLDIQACLE